MAVKWQPGWYLQVAYNSSTKPWNDTDGKWATFITDFKAAIDRDSRYKGVLIQFFWGHFEDDVQGIFHIADLIDEMLDYTIAHGTGIEKHILLRPMPTNFAGRTSIFPQWVIDGGGMYENEFRGYTLAKLWEQTWMDHWITAITALMDHAYTPTGQPAHPQNNVPTKLKDLYNMQGFITEETALGMEGQDTYTNAGFATQLVREIAAWTDPAKIDAPDMMFCQNINFLGGSVPNAHTDSLISELQNSDCGTFTWSDTFTCDPPVAAGVPVTVCDTQHYGTFGDTLTQKVYSLAHGPKGDDSLCIMAQFQADKVGYTINLPELIETARYYGSQFYIVNGPYSTRPSSGIPLSEYEAYNDTYGTWDSPFIACPTGFGSCNPSTGGPSNLRPVLASIGNRVATESLQQTFTVTATDPDTTTPTLSVTGTVAGDPASDYFTDNADGTGTWVYTPAVDDSLSSPYSVTFIATDEDDALLTATETISLSVVAPGIAPPVTGITGVTITIDASTQDEVIEGLDTSTISSPAGDLNLPVTQSYSVITLVTVVLRDTGPGWSYELMDKDTAGPRIRIYDNTDTLADAVIDAKIEGIA